MVAVFAAWSLGWFHTQRESLVGQLSEYRTEQPRLNNPDIHRQYRTNTHPNNLDIQRTTLIQTIQIYTEQTPIQTIQIYTDNTEQTPIQTIQIYTKQP